MELTDNELTGKKSKINRVIQPVLEINDAFRYEVRNQIKIKKDIVKEKTKLKQPKLFLKTFRNKKISNRIKELESKNSECSKKLNNIENITVFKPI